MPGRWAVGIDETRCRQRLVVRGLVQGVGFRPFVYALAHELGLSGAVGNTGQGVVIEIEGPSSDPSTISFGWWRRRGPPLARVDDLAAEPLPCVGDAGFVIRDSEGGGRARTIVSPDIATCADCLTELGNPADRRYRHPFISCTNCGPRFTIVVDLPYDRPTTTMADLPLCATCAGEYADPANRRFHAQTIACSDCGPTLTLSRPAEADLSGPAALAVTRQLLVAGAIVAVKGLGGYHLACDAGDETATATLRKRKDRGDKPFAVMVADIDAAAGLAILSPEERRAAHGFPAAGRAGPPQGRRTACAVGRARPSGRRVVVGLHAGPSSALRAAGRPARPYRPGDDERQPGRRADRHRRRRGPHPAGRPGRRLAGARPSDPGALRRLGLAGGRRRPTPGPALPRIRTHAGGPTGGGASRARCRRRSEEHVLRGRRRLRLAVGPRRGHGRPRHPAGLRPGHRAPAIDHRRPARGHRCRPPPRIPQRRRGHGDRGAHRVRAADGPAPPRAHRVGAGRERARRLASG